MADYNKLAHIYINSSTDLDKETRAYFYALLPDSLKGKSLLDVGCGSGGDAMVYAGKGAEVYGIDISEKQIELANEKNCGKFSVGNMKTLPYEENKFDIITSYYALQTSDDVPDTLQEMLRVTKNNGTLLILTKHPLTNLLESYVNDRHLDYYARRNVTSYIYNRSIKLSEPGHTLMDYFSPQFLAHVQIELFEEHTDFPASEQVIAGLIYPTYLIIKCRKI